MIIDMRIYTTNNIIDIRDNGNIILEGVKRRKDYGN